MRGPYAYSNPYYPSVGAWGTSTVGEEMKEALTREGLALFMALREQIMQPAPQNRMVIRPSVSAGVAHWWQTTAQPLFTYFGDWLRRGPLQNVSSWVTQLAQLRREAAQLGLLALPSAFFDAVDAELAR
jgi:hypothetical protein